MKEPADPWSCYRNDGARTSLETARFRNPRGCHIMYPKRERVRAVSHAVSCRLVRVPYASPIAPKKRSVVEPEVELVVERFLYIAGRVPRVPRGRWWQ